MQPGSQPSSSEPPPLPTITNFIGTVIALLTLMSPVAIVKHFSSDNLPAVSPPAVFMQRR